jgi:hypothetical protein
VARRTDQGQQRAKWTYVDHPHTPTQLLGRWESGDDPCGVVYVRENGTLRAAVPCYSFPPSPGDSLEYGVIGTFATLKETQDAIAPLSAANHRDLPGACPLVAMTAACQICGRATLEGQPWPLCRYAGLTESITYPSYSEPEQRSMPLACERVYLPVFCEFIPGEVPFAVGNRFLERSIPRKARRMPELWRAFPPS